MCNDKLVRNHPQSLHYNLHAVRIQLIRHICRVTPQSSFALPSGLNWPIEMISIPFAHFHRSLVVFLLAQSNVWSHAAVARPLQGWTGCGFRVTLQLNPAVLSRNLTAAGLPVILREVWFWSAAGKHIWQYGRKVKLTYNIHVIHSLGNSNRSVTKYTMNCCCCYSCRMTFRCISCTNPSHSLPA